MTVQQLTVAPVPGGALRPRLAWLASAVCFGVLPVTLVVTLLVDILLTGDVPVEPEAYYRAAEAVARGATPYSRVSDIGLIEGEGYVYPPLTAIGVVPLTLFSSLAAGFVMSLVVVAALIAIPYILGVRDWRCYGAMFLWPPVVLAIQTGNVNVLLALVAAAAWHYRDRSSLTGLALGIAFAQKLVLWPVGLWLAATRRLTALAWGAVAAATLLVGSWAVVDFEGLESYPGLLRRVSSLMDDRGYSLYAIAHDLGAPSAVARGLWAAVGVALLGAVILRARAGHERGAYILAIAATLAVTPVVWLHYFVFLLVVVALVQRRLGLLWLLPLLTIFTDGGGNPGPAETAATLAVVAATVALALRSSSTVTEYPKPSGASRFRAVSR